MKTNKFAFFVFLFVNIAVGLSCYFYPVTRDEFYYLGEFVNPFQEYFNAYHFGNPRIGQFFSNLVSRNIFLEILFGLLLFNGFFSVIFLNVFRRFPMFKNGNDMTKFLVISAFFIFLINYFGEMFYYTPFSGNYTFTHIFYLFFVFLFTDYYVFGKEDFLKKINYFVLIFFGIFVGMSNEHVPPVLLMMSFFAAVYYLIKNRKMPNLKLIVLPFAIFIGYLFLFFAPANSIKQETVGRSVLDIGIHSYAENFVKILKLSYYYNLELIIVSILILIIGIVFRKKIFVNRLLVKEILVYLLFAILPLFIVAVSPLVGTRLLFFSSSLIILVLIIVLKQLNKWMNFRKFAVVTSYSFLLLFFVASVFITFNADKNYESLISEIKNQKKNSDEIVLPKSFDYFTPNFQGINRRVLMEDGKLYIDKDATKDNSTERNLKIFYRLRSIRTE